ncbi:1147_t:CDS:2, partial [Ambispora leptoticha]
QKQAVVQNIKNDFQQAKAVIFYNFHQAENRELFRLKKELKKEDEYKPLSILNKFNKKYSGIKRFQGGIYEQKLVANTLLEK